MSEFAPSLLGFTFPMLAGLVAIVIAVFIIVSWRWASRLWPLPCPSVVGWVLESRLYGRLIGTDITLQRLDLRPGLYILEIGPGPGRLLIPAARRILPGGQAVGIDIQLGMVKRLQSRAKIAGLTNLQAILGDATRPIVAESNFDLVFLATTLGEIPDRLAALAQCHRALKPAGTLSVTEMLPDPHYQSRKTVKRLAVQSGFRLKSMTGNAWLFTASFEKV